MNVNVGGRPKKYTQEFVDNEADELLKWIDKDLKNIFIEKFCIDRDISDSRLYIFLEISERFRDAYNKLKQKQKLALFENGLNKKYAHPMCALILSHNHNIHLKTEQKLSGEIANPLQFVLSDENTQRKELIQDGKEIEISVQPRTDRDSEEEVGKPVLEAQQLISDCRQAGEEDTLPNELGTGRVIP